MGASRSPDMSRDRQTLLAEACARNLSAELHYHVDEELCTARTRLLGVSGDELQIDRPQSIGQPLRLTRDTRVTLYIAVGGELWALDGVVARTAAEVELNRGRRITGMILRLASPLRREQRREQFRVSLAKYDVPVILHGLAEGYLDAAPCDARRLAGRAVNISVGGVAVLCDARRYSPPTVQDVLFAVFSLPIVDFQLALPVETRHVRPVHAGLECIIGLRFIQPQAPPIRVQIQRVDRFVVEEQHRQLRQMRGR